MASEIRPGDTVQESQMNLWPHQTQAIDYIRKNSIERSGRSLVVMPPGSGKSEIAIVSVLEWLRRSVCNRAILCVPSKRLLGQFYSRLVTLTREPIGFEQGMRRAGSGARIVLASQPSLIGRMGKFADEHSMLICDEVHHSNYDAPEFHRVLSGFRRCIGLSATPWTNGITKIFRDCFFYRLSDAIAEKIICPIAIEQSSSLSLSGQAHTIVFVASNDAAKLLSSNYADSDWIGYSRDVNINLSTLDKWRHHQIKTLFVNRMLLEGFDTPETMEVWIDHEVRSVVMCAQIMGRALRYKPGKVARLCVLSDATLSAARQALIRMDERPTDP
jgi:superfamily II DNA or RNA helicase